MTETIIGTVVRLAAPLNRFGTALREALARHPWLRLIVAPLILLAAAAVALMALLAGRHGFALLTLFIALPLATLCLFLCRGEDED